MKKYRNIGFLLVFVVLPVLAVSAGVAHSAALKVPTHVYQSGTLAPLPATVAPPAPDAWETLESRKIQDMFLIEQLDSSGPDAWDPSAHPLVYITTLGPGYGGLYAKDWDPVNRVFITDFNVATTPAWQGLAIIDANTKEPIIGVEYPDLAPGSTKTNCWGVENHGIGTSADGQWIYVQGYDSRSTTKNKAVLNIINARTLKVDKIINSRVHHARNVKDYSTGKDLVLIDGWDNKFYMLDPSDNNRVVKAAAQNDLNGAGYLGFVDYSGKYLFVTTRTGFSSEGGVTIFDMSSMKVARRITTGDASPIWVTFSSNGQYAYVAGGHESTVARINMSDPSPANWRYDAHANSGAQGPYGVTLNWDDTVVLSVAKNEGAANKGQELGITFTNVFSSPDTRIGRALGEIYLGGCIRPDHAILHPDPAVNEMWIACNSSMETAVVDLGDNTTIFTPTGFKFEQSIPTPMGGSTHNGAFVEYTLVSAGTWTGELLADTNGMQGRSIALKQSLAAAAGN